MNIVDFNVDAFRSATRRLEKAQAEESQAAKDRIDALWALWVRGGLTHKQIAELVGLSPARIGQLMGNRRNYG